MARMGYCGNTGRLAVTLDQESDFTIACQKRVPIEALRKKIVEAHSYNKAAETSIEACSNFEARILDSYRRDGYLLQSYNPGIVRCATFDDMIGRYGDSHGPFIMPSSDARLPRPRRGRE